MNSSIKLCNQLKYSPQLTQFWSRGYKVHFLKSPAAERMSTPMEQKQLFDIVSQTQKEDSYLIFNPKQTSAQIKNWKKQLDWITPFYAIKANPSDGQLEIAKKEQLGFDCASASEIKKVLSLDVEPKRIIFSNSVKKIGDIKFARENQVNLTTADTIDELHKIRAFHPNCDILWRIAIPELHSQQLATTFSHKFGDDLLVRQDMEKRFKQIKDLGFNLAGIHFHCGSGASGSQNFAFALDITQECLKIGRQIGHRMNVLDLGGGFPAGRLPRELTQILQRLKGDSELQTIMAEPGRHLASNSFDLVCHVIGKRRKQGHVMYHINDSVYHMMNCVLMDGVQFARNDQEWYAEWSKKENEGGGWKPLEFEEGTLVGMTCDGQDIIAKNVKMPEMEIGDAIIINGMGAYTLGPVSNFNGMKVSQKVQVWHPQLEEQELQILEKAALEFTF